MPELQEKLVGFWGEIRHLNYLGCHGIPERCLVIRGKRMKICARCVGAIIGHVISFALFLFGHLLSLYIASGLIVIMLVDWSLQRFMGIPSTNLRRLLTGFVGGLGVGIFILTGVGWLLHNITKLALG